MSQPEPIEPADPTVEHYQRTAASFFAATVGVDMAPLHARFLACMPRGARILDAGCGSGRDAKAFSLAGCQVTAFDASPELARMASKHSGLAVAVRSFDDVDEVNAYDGIWCCASLLHVPRAALEATVHRLWRALRLGGTLYASFKQGRGERLQDGRRFTDLEEGELRGLLSRLPGLESVDIWVTRDQRPERAELWVNAMARLRAEPEPRGRPDVCGDDRPVIHEQADLRADIQ